MPLVPQEHGPPSTLADVIGQVVDAFDAMGDPTTIQVGKHYLEDFGVGHGPRVLFVPETDGRVSAPREMGRAASVLHGCQVLIRAEEGDDDIDRFRRAYLLEDRVIGCLSVAASGRIEWGTHGDGSPVDVTAYGAEVAFGFLFRRDVQHDPQRWALPPADQDGTGAKPVIPPGTPGELNQVDVTVDVDPEES